MGNLGKGQFGDLGKRQFREGEIWGMEKFGELWRGILDRGAGAIWRASLSYLFGGCRRLGGGG